MGYKNFEGYSDPVMGEVLRRIRIDEKEQARQAAYEQLCENFRKQASECGFQFTKDIWLVHERTKKFYKGG